jgi:predicted ATPase
MKLKSARIKEFKSVWDSGEFSIGHVTCLVGKNEAGKSSLLEALYRLNPILPKDGNFDPTDDYPRSAVEDYLQDIESGNREHAVVITATFAVDAKELDAINAEFGTGVLIRPEVTVWKSYQRDKEKNCVWNIVLHVNELATIEHLVAKFELPPDVHGAVKTANSLKMLSDLLAAHVAQLSQAKAVAEAAAAAIEDEAEKASALQAAKALGESEPLKALRAYLKEFPWKRGLAYTIWDKHLHPHYPTFMYFDEYYQMQGHDNVEALKARRDSNSLKSSDRPLLGLIELARLDIDKLETTRRTQELKNKLQGASNYLSNQILKYWSQNKHLRMNFDVRPAMPGDPPGMTSGTNIWGEVFDSKHLVSTGLATRSTGFVWFFSFLAWYSSVKKEGKPIVLLLDEPGLSLHGRAQEDLLRYFEAEIASNPRHQLIYTTHSPFMVDAQHFDRVRIVQDRSIDTDDELPRDEDGTKVLTDVLLAGPDSLFPLQGALGYDVYQTLFIGPNALVVEGVSDLLYLQTISGVLQRSGRKGLDSRWTITPVGGAQKVPTFVALIGARSNINVATLIDFQKSDKQMIENLYKQKLLKRTHVHTFADYTGAEESDIEDMFGDSFYLELVNGEYGALLPAKLSPQVLKANDGRVLVRLASWLTANALASGTQFNHYRPARYFSEQTSLQVPAVALDRFQKAFNALNALLPN